MIRALILRKLDTDVFIVFIVIRVYTLSSYCNNVKLTILEKSSSLTKNVLKLDALMHGRKQAIYAFCFESISRLVPEISDLKRKGWRGMNGCVSESL